MLKKILPTRLLLLALLTLIAVAATAQRKQFFNLSANDIKIDSVLPRFNHTFPLSGQFADSVYTVSLRYPEFIDMPPRDIALYDSISGASMPDMPDVESYVSLNRRQGQLDVGFSPFVMRNGKKQILVSFMINVESKPLKRSLRKVNKQQEENRNGRYASHSVLAQGRWAKIRVPANGIYQITDALISQAGFSDISKVKIYGYGGNLLNERLEPDELIALDDLQEVPTCKQGSRRLFYGKGPVSWPSPAGNLRTRNPYSDYGYYFLTQDDSEPQFVDSIQFVNSFYPANDDYHTLYEVDNFAWYHGGRKLFDSDPITSGKTKTIEMTVPEGNTTGKFYINLTGEPGTHVNISFNDSVIGTISLYTQNLQTASEYAVDYKVFNLQPVNTIKLENTGTGTARLDHITLIFNTPRVLPNIASATFPTPEYVHNIANQDHHADPQADMVIIIPTSQRLRSQAERLAAFHQSRDGMRVNIVPADELYNEFSSGTPDASAYRKYLKMLYDRASTTGDMPKFLLLFGDCAWDNRMLSADWRTTSVDDFLLCYESDNSFHQYSSFVNDSWFALLDDGEGLNPYTRDKYDMAVGRFPVRTEEEARIMTDKTINYVSNQNSGDWQNIIMFMGDDDPKSESVNLHMTDMNTVADEVIKKHPAYMMKKIMWDAYTRVSTSTGNRYPDIETVIKQQQANGALIMNYGGHGSETSISHERVLVLDDFKNFQNTNYPLWIINACDIMPFDSNMSTIGEEAVLNKRGGAVAVYSTSRTVYAQNNLKMNSIFMKYVLSLDDSGKPMTLGEAARLSKNNISTRTTNDIHYHLLGDPALSLQLPTYDVVIDSINGVDIGKMDSGSIFPTLHAGTIATMSGHIEYAGERVDTFNGRMTATVRDTEETIVCKKNHPQQTLPAFQYTDRPKTLFNGSNDVKNGKFSFSFAVPLDINYADGSGQVIVHATSDDHQITAHGMSTSFNVGGTGEMSNDSIGPSIYCYLNSSSFVDGGDVNSTPYFVAQITDKDGINASGAGIGHDMELIIDGDMTKTYSLNDNFRFDYGSYTNGTTYYYIPELEPGQHQLKFRAWDVQNNSSTAVLSFNVVRGLQPSLYSVDCTNNPASTNTTFIISHDRMGCPMDVDLEIFDTSGRLLWRHSESGVVTDQTYTIDWDLTIDGGQRLHTGVYLYRVLVSTDGSKKASKAKKLIIINNK